jgi:hypothetical protein
VCDAGNSFAPETTADEAVVIEYRHAVSRAPHVALEPRGAELSGQLERLNRVLRGVGTGPAMSEADRRAAERLHSVMMPAPVRSVGND